jgi:16S rRNA (guanine966-N2)-methyltransferase
LRVIAGKAKGRKLQAPPGLGTRPITDMIKEALFNILQPQVVGSDFLDLYAGSGSVGIEALSRGAASAVFVDNSFSATKIIHDNLDKCGLQGEVYRRDVFDFLVSMVRQKRTFDIIYADPPFTNEVLFERTLCSLDKHDLLNSGGMIIIRVPRNTELPAQLNGIEKHRKNIYGESALYFYRSVKEGGSL